MSIFENYETVADYFEIKHLAGNLPGDSNIHPLHLTADDTADLIQLLHDSPEPLARNTIGEVEYLCGVIQHPTAPRKIRVSICWDGYAESRGLLFSWHPILVN